MSRRKATIVEDRDFAQRLIEVCGTDRPAELGRFLDTSYQAARNYLSGRIPDTHILTLIALKTNYSINWLLTGTGAKRVSLLDGVFNGDEIRENIKREMVDILRELARKNKNGHSVTTVELDSAKIKNERKHEEHIMVEK